MRNISNTRKYILFAVIAAAVALLIIFWPFSDPVCQNAKAFQNLSGVHGHDYNLFEAMEELKEIDLSALRSEWNLVETSSEYITLSEIAADSHADEIGAFYTHLCVCVLAIALFLTAVALLGGMKVFLLCLGALFMVFPFYWMIASSFKTAAEMNIFPPKMAPGSWLNFSNYNTAWNAAPFGTYFFNSIFVCVCSVGVVMFTTILAAFAFSRLEFPGRDLLFTLLLSMMMVPFELLVITNFQTVTRLGLRDTLACLILPFTSSIFYTYILRNFFMSVPDSLYRSSQVDGAGNWQYLWKVMVPIAGPSLVTILLLNAMASWNSFMWPQLVIAHDEVRTLPWALVTFTTEVGSHDELIMSGATLVVLPMLILFLFARKQIVRGVARGGIKG